MSFNPPNLSEIYNNENELNNRLIALRNLLNNQWDAIGESYSQSDSINKLITDMSNPLPFLVKRNSDYNNNQLGDRVAITGCSVYSWNKYNPTQYSDTDYWYLQSLSGTATNNTAVAWGQFNVGNVSPTDKFDLVMYGRSIENFNNNAFSGVGFTYQTPTTNNPLTGLFIGITLDSGTYYPAYAIFNNNKTPTVTKIEYVTYSVSDKFRLGLLNNVNSERIDIRWYDGEGDFKWNTSIDYSELPSGFTSLETLQFGNICYSPSIGRVSYVPRLYFASPCRFNIL